MRPVRSRTQQERAATIEVDGHRVGLTAAGEGPPLVLLHGLGRDREDWRAVQPVLAERFTTYAVDLEGFGDSEAWDGPVSLASMARTVRRTLAAAGERRPLRLVGNSMGGAVALRMTADDPGAIAGLVLISPAGFGREAVFTLRLLTVPVVGSALLALDSSRAALRLRALRPDPSEPGRERATASSLRLRRAAMRRQYIQVIHDLGGWSGIHEAWRAEVLQALAAAGTPTLVLWGDRDTVLPYAHLASVQAAVPHALVEPLPGLGHMPQLEQPERIARLIDEFLAA